MPIECPCGCKQLPDGDGIKRHLGILALMVFVCTLGLVALSSMERDRVENNATASLGPGAIQAAESTFPTISPTELPNNTGYYSYATPVQPVTVTVPIAQPTDIRHDRPSHMVMAVTSMDGKTRIKRIVGR